MAKFIKLTSFGNSVLVNTDTIAYVYQIDADDAKANLVFTMVDSDGNSITKLVEQTVEYIERSL